MIIAPPWIEDTHGVEFSRVSRIAFIGSGLTNLLEPVHDVGRENANRLASPRSLSLHDRKVAQP